MPPQLTGFIAREQEIAEVRRLLTTTRLRTLTGARGVGKTRLARQVGAEPHDVFAAGAWLVELAACLRPTPGSGGGDPTPTRARPLSLLAGAHAAGLVRRRDDPPRNPAVANMARPGPDRGGAR